MTVIYRCLSLIFDKIFKQKRLIMTIILLAAIIVLWRLKQVNYLNTENIIAFLRSYPLLAPFLFIVIYALMIVFLLPTLPLNLGAGFLWGFLLGGFIAVISASLGGLISFTISRYIASDFLKKKFNNKIWRQLEERVRRANWKAVAFTRLNPVFPFGLVNYFFGLTSISFREYAWSTIVFILPPAFLMAYLGDFIGGFVLEGASYDLIRNIFIISLIITLLIALRFILKSYFQNRKII